MNRPEGFPLTVDTLVNTNGNYIIAYTYSNWGDNVLFILPNLQMTIEEQDINTAVMDAAYDRVEMAELIDQFLQEFPDTPFIGRGNCIAECVKTMNERLSKYKTFEEFADDSAEFDKWRIVVYRASGDHGVMFKAYDEGWRSAIQKEVVMTIEKKNCDECIFKRYTFGKDGKGTISMNIYNQLSFVKIDDRLIRSRILINTISEVAMISTEIHGDYRQYKSYIYAIYDEINNTKIPYPKKLTDTIIHKTCTMLGMDIDGDVTDYPKWIAYRDNMIRHNPRIRIQVKWYKTLFKIKCLINKILGGKS